MTEIPSPVALDADRLFARLVDVHDDSLATRAAALLADVAPGDVPRIVVAAERAARVVDPREAFVLARLDGIAPLEDIVDAIDLPTGDVLSIVCRLCAKGIVVLDRPAGARAQHAA